MACLKGILGVDHNPVLPVQLNFIFSYGYRIDRSLNLGAGVVPFSADQHSSMKLLAISALLVHPAKCDSLSDEAART